MYVRQVKEKPITLSVSGMLWNRSLVMLDIESKSLWSQLMGKAMAGEHKGAQLEMLPSQITDWQNWHALHPDTTVVMLSRTAERFKTDFYKNPSQFVLGLNVDGKFKHYSFKRLMDRKLVNDRLGETDLLIVFDSGSSTALAFDRTVQGKRRTFEIRDGKLYDRQSGSTWNPRSGQATAGRLKGEQLKPIAAVVSYRNAWQTFHPDSNPWQR